MALRHSLKTKILACAVLILAAALTHSVWLAWMGEWLVHDDPPDRADAIVVLAGDPFGYRILKAAELAKNGFARAVLVSGPSGFYDVHECDLAIPFAVRHGYPADWFIPVPHDGHSTDEEARAVFPVLTSRQAHRVIVVTSNYHTARARRTLLSDWPGIDIRMIAASDRFFTPGSWWRNREGRKIFLLEWVKTLARFVRM